MSPAPGDTIGPYQIVGLLGVGGMGQVFRARDSRLNRDVALKLLPEDVAHDPGRLARFRREAQLLAALNHPNIAAIYGLEETAGVRALVLELVEGPTLEDVIAQSSPAPRGVGIDDALPIARQIAEALEAAHDQGIVHRDLKPANIKLRPDGVVKVLDFGLAKAIQPDVGSGVSRIDVTSIPTLTSPAMTMQGVILGTAAYMSPEQAKGRQTDRRTDIFAFGCVLFEMLTGQRAFDAGDSVSEAIANVLKTEPDWNALPAATPSPIRRLLRRCLAKDPQKREPHIGAARLAIDETREGTNDDVTTPADAGPARSWRVPVVWAASAAVLTTAVLVGTGALRREVTPERAVTFEVPPPSGWQLGTPTSGPPAPHYAVSPDGSRIVFAAYPEPMGSSQLWLRRLRDTEPTALRGTEGATFPFWSPDGRFIAFFADGRLKKIDASGGPVGDLCPATGPGSFGGTWSADDTIVFTAGNSALLRVSGSGGTPVPATTLEPDETSHRWPQFLPDGRRFLYLASAGSQWNLYVGSLDAAGRTLVRASTYRTLYSRGYLLSVTEDATMTMQAFDPGQARTTAEPQPLIERVGINVVNANSGFSVAESGVLAFREGVGISETLQLYWADRSGNEVAVVAEPRPYTYWRLSPDERAIVARIDDASGRADWWLIDLARGGLARQLTFTGEVGGPDRAAWSPNNEQIVLAMGPNPSSMYLTHVLSGDAPETLLRTADINNPMDWSPDGRTILFNRVSAKTGVDLWTLSLDTGEERPFLLTEFNETFGRFSRDGRWVAYQSNQGGTGNVYVKSASQDDKRVWKISSNGGANPRWCCDGREIVFNVGRIVMAAALSSDGTLFRPETPRELFQARVGFVGRFEVSANGQHFLFAEAPAERPSAATSPITVVVNWPAHAR